jgi:hypothetical protein
MHKSFLIILCFCISFSSQAADLCTRTQSDLKLNLLHEDSRIAFKNNGGIFNGGVCWWHSRLQRSSLYLVRFQPHKNPPTISEVQKILKSLREMKTVVNIPGHSNFRTFSQDFQKEIQQFLNQWQKRDGIFNSEWTRGISGRSSLSSEEMKIRMNDIYKFYKDSPTPLWIMAQIKGITAHSFLVVDMLQTESGYEMNVVDSNHPAETTKVSYYHGDTSLKVTGEDYSFVPYVGFQNDFKLIASALKNECGHLTQKWDLERLKNGNIELPHLQY